MSKFPLNNHKQNNKGTKIKKSLIKKAKFSKSITNKRFNIKQVTDNEQVNVREFSSFKLNKKKIENGSERSTTDFTPLCELVEQYTPDPNCCIIDYKESWISQLIVERKEQKPALREYRRRLKQSAEWLYNHEVKLHISNQSSNSKSRKMVLTYGTANDMVSALTSCCFEFPVHSLHELGRLLKLIDPKRKLKSGNPIENVLELFKTTYLADGHVAKEFECHAISSLSPYISSSPKLIMKQLILWYFEDKLRESYLQFVEVLSLLSNQQVIPVQSMAIMKLSKLLINHTKQDAEIGLRKLVNKLGDKQKKVAGIVVNQLRKIQEKCPELRQLMVSLVNTFLYRNGFTERSQFHGLCVLSHITLTRNDPLARTLIEIYFQFFEACIKKGVVDNRFMSCLLTGLHVAFRKCEENIPEEKITVLYRMCHLVDFKRATQVAQIIFQSKNLNERYYNLIYKMILNPKFGKSSNSTSSFLNLIYRSMERDTELSRILAFMKRLIQVALYLSVSAVCGILKVISQVIADNVQAGRIRENLTGSDSEDESLNASNFFKSAEDTVNKTYKITSYDPRWRNPLYARAELSNLWGLHILKNHYHPSVRAFVEQLFTSGYIDYSGDPFIDFSFAEYLKKFCNKKAKKTITKGNRKLYGNNKNYIPEGARSLAVDSKEFLALDPSDVPVDQLFFHKYYNMSNKSQRKSRSKALDNTEIDDDEFERIMRQSNFKQYVDPDLEDVDFAKGVAPRNESSSLDEDAREPLLMEQYDEDEYEEDSDDSEPDDDIFDDFDDMEEEQLNSGKKPKEKKGGKKLQAGGVDSRKRFRSNSTSKKNKRSKR